MKKRGVRKTTAKKSKLKCPKCGYTQIDFGTIQIGRLYAGHEIGYRSDKHHPYAGHVNQRRATMCTKCGYVEIYFDVEDLKRKLKKHR